MLTETGSDADRSLDPAHPAYRLDTECESRGASGDGHALPGLWGLYGAVGVLLVVDWPDLVGPDAIGLSDRFLVVRRGLHLANHAGLWQLPGGALDERETPGQAAARELAEEVGMPRRHLRHTRCVGVHIQTVEATGLDRPWRYTTLVVRTPVRFTPIPDGGETRDARWFDWPALRELRGRGHLHPALAQNLEALLSLANPRYPARTRSQATEE